MNFKYERLLVFCHYCGLLGRDLRYCAKYFSKMKTRIVMECSYGDWLKATGGRARSPQKRGFVKEDSSDGDKRIVKGPSEAQSTTKVDENGGGIESKPNKTVMGVREGVTRLVGAGLAGHRDAKNHGLGGVDKEGRVSSSIDLGVQNSSLDWGGGDLALAIC